jgi:hypothetical protein
VEDVAPLWWIGLGLLALGAVLSAALARQEPGHHHAARAALLGGNTIAEIVQRLTRAHLLPLPTPYEGLDRVLFHVGQAAFLAWPVGVAALALYTLARCRPTVLVVGASVMAFAVAGAYPGLRAEELVPIYRGWYGVGVVVGIGSLVLFGYRRGYPVLEHACTGVLVTGELVVLAGAFSLGVFSAWPAAQLSYAVTFGAVAALSARHLWRTRRTHGPTFAA